MAHPYILAFALSEGAGQSPTASVVDQTGAAIGSQPTYSIVDLGGGFYHYYTAVMPDGQYGIVKIILSAVVKAIGVVNPTENENADVRTSSRSTYAGGSVTLETSEYAAIADKVLGRSIAGGTDGGRTVKDALRFQRNAWSISASTLTVTTEDDTTPAWTATLTFNAGGLVTSFNPD